jgi:hypothetical protein
MYSSVLDFKIAEMSTNSEEEKVSWRGGSTVEMSGSVFNETV